MIVIPAQAGIQSFHVVRILWIPVFTGITTFYEFINLGLLRFLPLFFIPQLPSSTLPYLLMPFSLKGAFLPCLCSSRAKEEKDQN